MIYTVTFNPAIDYVMYIDTLKQGETNRAESEEIYFGGKGINVSTVLAELGAESTALGFIAGWTGEALEHAVREAGVSTDFIRLDDGNTRINIKLKSGAETEINAQGPKISEKAIKLLYKKLDTLKSGDTLVLAGSVPKDLPENIYENILQRLSSRGIRFVVDATGDLLLNVLKYKPFLIKPNRRELEQLCGTPMQCEDDVISAARKLRGKGAVNVLVSLGRDGALLIDEFDCVHKQNAMGGKPINTVGAGDSMVAGFLKGCERDYEYALLLGSAAGGATACSKGLATRAAVSKLLEQHFI